VDGAVVGVDDRVGEVEFPGGRVELSTVPPDDPRTTTVMVAVREPDPRFVLDTLATLDTGHNPDAEHRPLPAGRFNPEEGGAVEVLDGPAPRSSIRALRRATR